MTLGDVVDALRDLAVDAPPAEGSTSRSRDHRDRLRLPPRRRRLGVRRPQGAARRRRRVRGAGRVARARWRWCPKSPRPGAFAVPWVTVTRRAACARAARRSLFRSPEPAHAGHRRHWHERQDDDGLSAGLNPRCGRPSRRHARHRRVSHRRRGPRSLAHHARGARRAAAVERNAASTAADRR